MHSIYLKTAFSAVSLISLLQLNAQDTQQKVIDLRPYTVTGSLSSSDPDATILPVTSLSGKLLEESRANTLGETLELIPGMQSTAFGSSASRPIIRGFDGPRVQILQDGLSVADVSADSPDHAVNVTPDFAEYIDIIRGPSTLLYGGSAVGGVINVVGGVFPAIDLESGIHGTIESGYHTVNRGWNHQLRTSLNNDQWALQFSVSNHDFGDYDIPGYPVLDEGNSNENEALEKGRLSQSFSYSNELSFGLGKRLNENWNIAVALASLDQNYGVTERAPEGVEEEEEEEGGVSIDMKQWRGNLELLGQWKDGVVQAFKWRLHYSDYDHVEMEGDEVGTSFDKKLWTSRMEFSNAINDQIFGVFGFQWDDIKYQSVGEEALLPGVESKTAAWFVAENWEGEHLSMNGGARWEWNQLNPEADLPEYDDGALSLSTGLDWSLTEESHLNLVFTRSSRHPSATELFADGLHAATSSYEVGDVSLEKEISNGVDLRYEWNSKRWKAALSAYINRFDNYIYAQNTGDYIEGYPVYQFVKNDADFSGFEGELSWNVLENENHELEISLVGDLVHANLLDTGERLPRVPAKRIGVSVSYKTNGFSLASDFRHVFAVDEIAENESASDSYNIWNMYLSFPLSFAHSELKLILKLKNILDEEIRPHTSFLKDVAPQPGRGAELGVRWEF